jgi:hypothetical protein
LLILQVSSTGKRRQLAAVAINMKQYANVVASHQEELKITMKPTSKKIVSASLEFTICSVLIREGKATYDCHNMIKLNFIIFISMHYSDEDMQSMASLMSTNNTIDIAIMKDFDEEEEDEGVKELGDLTSQIDLLTNSISENEWNSSNTTPVPSIPCSPRDEIPLKFDEPELPMEPLASS